MGVDISLEIDGLPVSCEPHTLGSNICVGGLPVADFSCTYNYGEVYRLIGFSWRDIEGKTGEESIPILESAVAKLSPIPEAPPRPYKDYWAATPGNALVPLKACLGWAKQNPAAIWRMGW